MKHGADKCAFCGQYCLFELRTGQMPTLVKHGATYSEVLSWLKPTPEVS